MFFEQNGKILVVVNQISREGIAVEIHEAQGIKDCNE
jgi:hypothetical protein